MNNKIEEDRREINELENELEMYKSFVKVYNSKKLFDKYVIEKIEGRT